jgi:hypothetical protein
MGESGSAAGPGGRVPAFAACVMSRNRDYVSVLVLERLSREEGVCWLLPFWSSRDSNVSAVEEDSRIENWDDAWWNC